jgi:hypothetical protein
MEASTGSIFCEVVEVDMLILWRPTTDDTAAGAEAVREKRVAVPELLVVIRCDECEAKARAGVKAAVPSDEKGDDVKASKDAAKREPSKALL